MLAGKSNGFFAKKILPFEKQYLRNGIKRLIHSVVLDDGTTVLLVHLSPLSKKVRERQIQEIKEKVNTLEKVIICGDFNIWGGFSELTPLLEDGKLVIMNKQEDKTYPSYNPRYALDIFICSKGIAGRGNVKVLKNCDFSDHLPVVLELTQ